MAKITKFSYDPELYYNLAVRELDDGRYTQCLELLWQALKFSGDDDEAKCEIYLLAAEAYAAMENFTLSNKCLFKLLAEEYELEEVFYMLIKNCLYTESAPLAFYYVKMGMEMGVLDPEMALSAMDNSDDIISDAPISLVTEDSGEGILKLAKQLMNSGGSEYARQMLAGMPKNSKQYHESRVCLALFEYNDGNYDKCIKYCDEVLDEDDAHFAAFTAKILALNAMGDKTGADELIARIGEFELKSFPELSRATHCFCELGNSEEVLKYSGRILKLIPYDREMLLLNALACANTGDKTAGKENIIKLLAIYPDDYSIKYAARKIDSLKAGESLPLKTELDINEKKRLVLKIENDCTECASPKEFAKKALTDPELNDAVTWVLYNANYQLASRVAEMLLDGGDKVIIPSALIDSEFPPIVKKCSFMYMLTNGKHKKIRFVFNNEMRLLRPRIPACTEHKGLASVYWRVYGTLAFIEPDFERRLAKVFKTIAPAMETVMTPETDLNLAAAMLAYKSNTAGMFDKAIHCCELFGCKEEEFAEFEEQLNLELLNKNKKTSGATGTAKKISAEEN